MKKITLLLFTIAISSFTLNAQHTFSTVPGPVNVAEGSPVTLNINDMVNSASVPAGSYLSYTVTLDWAAGGGGPWSNEAEVRALTAAGATSLSPATSGAGSDGNPTTMTFEGIFSDFYDPTVDGTLDIVLFQTYSGSDANFSNIVVTIDAYTPPPPPATVATITIGTAQCGVAQTTTNAYDPGVSDVNWIEFVYDGTCDALTFDTFSSVLEDTEIGLYDSDGIFIDSNDDAPSGGLLSELSISSLAAGTYYIAVGGYDITFGPISFNATSDETEVNDITVNVLADAPLSLDNVDAFDNFSYFPNPVKNELNLKAQSNIQNVSIYNMLGQEVVRTAPNSLQSEVSMSNLSNGAYFVKVTINDVTETIRILKQ
jgi:hypothetical protein